MSDPAATNGFIDWLIYIILGLASGLFALWNTYFGTRITKNELGIKEVRVEMAAHKTDLHKVELAIESRFLQHEREERDRDELHQKELAREFTELRREMTAGHDAIMKQVNQLAREVKKNGNGRT